MTDELTPEQEMAVRRLLSEARHDEPVPADVADRLDRVLDGLAADPDSRTVDELDDLDVLDPGASGSVTELAGVRRRRRNAGRLILAAAAIVIGGVAVGQALGDTNLEGDDAGGSAAGTALAPREGEAGDTAAPQTGADATSGSDAPEAAPAPAGALLLGQVEVPVELSSSSFAADVQRQLRRTGAERSAAANSDYDGVTTFASGTFVCADGPYGPGAKLPAYYDAEEAVLVLRRPRAGIQRVDLLTCGTAEPLNSVDLPAP